VSSIGPAGGALVRETDHLTAEWSFGPESNGPVRRLVRLPDHDTPTVAAAPGRALVIGCGALARELVAVAERIPGLDVACLAPDLHNRPDGIPAAVRGRIRRARADGYERIFVAYADCGTGGLLDPVLADEGVERLPGAHCYEVFAGGADFAAMADAEPGTFWLTDFLARNFERLVIRGLGIDRHPELQSIYFANYTHVVYLSQTEDAGLLELAQSAATRLGLAFEHRPTGIAHFSAPIEAWASAGALATPDSRGTGDRDRRTAGEGRLRRETVVGARPAGRNAQVPDRMVVAARAAGTPAVGGRGIASPAGGRVAAGRAAIGRPFTATATAGTRPTAAGTRPIAAGTRPIAAGTRPIAAASRDTAAAPQSTAAAPRPPTAAPRPTAVAPRPPTAGSRAAPPATAPTGRRG
jgi:Protein of unknown function (DUF1638)